MIKICPECINISVDSESCKTCGFPFGKKMIGRLEDYFFYDCIDLVNMGQKEEAKLKIAEKQKIKDDIKFELLNEKISIVENLLERADGCYQRGLQFFQKGDYASAKSEIKSAIGVYNNPRYSEFDKQLDEAIQREKECIQANDKFTKGVKLIKEQQVVSGLQLLKDAVNLDSGNKEYEQLYEKEVDAFKQKTLSECSNFIENKRLVEAKNSLLLLMSFVNDHETKELYGKIEQLKMGRSRRKSVLVAVIVVCIIASGAFFLLKESNANDDFKRWILVKEAADINSLNSFIRENTDSRYYKEANEQLKSLLSKDSLLWLQVLKTHQRYEVEKYLKEMEPLKGIFINDAKQIIDSLDWVEISTSEDASVYQGYLSGHPDGRYAALARSRLSLEPSQSEKVELTEYLVGFFQAFERKDLETIIMYFNPVTPVFGSKRNISKADLHAIYENDLRTTSSISFTIDPTSVKVKRKDTDGYNITFYTDTYTTRVNTEIIDDTEVINERKYYTNSEWNLELDSYRKITVYKYKIISEKQIKE